MDEIVFEYRSGKYTYLPAWSVLCPLAEQYISATANGLDIGCGRCCFPNATGVDLYEPCAKIKSNGQVLDIPDNSYDFVISSHSIEHMQCWQSALKEWVRVIRSEGVVLLLVPDPDYFPWSKAGAPTVHFHDIRPADIRAFVESQPNMELLESGEPTPLNQHHAVIRKRG